MTTNTTARTPGPWKMLPAYTEFATLVYGADGNVVMDADTTPLSLQPRPREEDIANAAFIVRAANSHDPLVEALTLVRDTARCPVNGQERIADCQQCGCSLGLVIPAALAKARQP